MRLASVRYRIHRGAAAKAISGLSPLPHLVRTWLLRARRGRKDVPFDDLQIDHGNAVWHGYREEGDELSLR